ncbi:hypothetical protein HHI36_024339 [Cryptolaemus montrouzieri]|uniref:Uncharacterized protein n=1 Tax=Cryptolaemus montrouzieri TaxID=559131 RepID=A0ABD2N7H8_9CUCU
MMKKAEDDDEDPHLCLLEYRSTPIDANIKSPVLLFNKEINSLLPKFFIFNQVKGKEETRNSLEVRQMKQKEYYDKNAKDLEEVRVNEEVRVQNQNKTAWEPGQVSSRPDEPRMTN